MGKTSSIWIALVLARVAGFAGAVAAGVGDPTLRTDHPHYPGEGALQTIEDCVSFATAGKAGEQEKALALFDYLLTHQFHLMSPQEWSVPGRTPDSANGDAHDMVVYDANRARFSYGYGLCGTVHAWNEPYWRALGMPARRRAFPGHVNSEVFYGGGWHAFDTDMAGVLFRDDGIVAGYEDIMRQPPLTAGARPPIPCYPFAWPSDFDGMKRGWLEVARQPGKWYKMYHSGYAALPGVVHLRAGERFTRYFDRDRFGGPARRRFWHHQPGGPFRNWTFVNTGEPRHDGAQSNGRGNASYANAEFVYRPPFDSDRLWEGVAARSGPVRRQPHSPRLASSDGSAVAVTFSHFSPYVICGDPLDDANPMSGPAAEGLVIRGRAHGRVAVEVSADGARSWQDAGTLAPEFSLDLTEPVKGRYGWHVRFRWAGQAGLDELVFATTGQVCQAIYPRLRPNGSKVVYRSADRAVVAVMPNFGLDEEQLEALEVRKLRAPNTVYAGRSEKSRLAYQVQGPRPGAVVFRMSAPAELVEVSAAARFAIRVPPPGNCDYYLEVSTDAGRTWQRFAEAPIPKDNEYSSGWMYGRVDVSQAKTKEAFVRVHLYAGGTPTGLIAAEMYGLYETAPAAPCRLNYGWIENGQRRTFSALIPAGAREQRFSVPTGAAIVDDFVRLEAE